MSNVLVQPVILAGGCGSRLWPLSRAGFPKQFIALSGQGSLFQQAVMRLATLGLSDVAAPLIVTQDEHRFIVAEQLCEIEIEPAAVLLEPVGRNTAPALMLAALQAIEGGADPVLVVVAADQTIADQEAYASTVQQAVQQAAAGRIVVIGVKPRCPETGYGYVRATAAPGAAKVDQLVEKPDLATAQRFLSTGDYFWNAGLFVLKASVWLAALERFRPDIGAASQAAWARRSVDRRFVRPGKAEFTAVPSDSIDCAVMARCPGSGIDIRMVELATGWTDLGAWEAVWQVLPKDEQGNARVGDTIVSDSRNTLVHSTSCLVSAVGLDDVVIVETPDAVLVTRREKSQDVKHIATRLSAEQRGEQALHRKVHRPWGWYDRVDSGPRHQVKRILVKPGESLSLQMHHHRAEHWIVVSGTAAVTNGGEATMLTENQSIFIPLGQQHRLANPGKVPLEIIEVQSGSYLDEDDIVRLHDAYGRA